MENELDILEKWIKADIHPEKLLSVPNECNTKDMLLFVTNERDRICKCFWSIAIGNQNTEATCRYIKIHQLVVLNLTDVLIAYTQDEIHPPSAALKTFYLKVCTIIEEILTYIQQFLPAFFNEELPIPYITSIETREELQNSLQSLQALYLIPDIEKTLLNLALQPIKEFVNHANEVTTYKDLRYLKELVRDISSLLDWQEGMEINFELHGILLQLNFNLPRYVLYCCTRLDDKLHSMKTPKEKLDTIVLYLRTIEIVQYKPGFAYITGIPDVTEQIVNSVKITFEHLLNTTPHREKKTIGKIKTNFSVNELAALVKIATKAGDIKNEIAIEVIRFYAEHYTTVQADEISEDSFRAKYYKVEIGTYESLLETLDTWAKIIRKEIS